MNLLRILLLLCLASPAARAGDEAAASAPPLVGAPDGSQIALRVGKHRIVAEVASTPSSRRRGLMHRDSLCEGCGMLFVFEQSQHYSFWMKDTPLPLAIAFIRADGSIVNIEEMRPLSLETHLAGDAVLYALEMNAGWFSRHEIGPGDKISGMPP